MTTLRTITRTAIALLLLAPLGACKEDRPYPRYEPTPHDIAAQMLELAGVKAGDVVYDLGSGDGRIVIAAVRDFGAARAVGVDLDATLVELAADNAREAAVDDRVSFLHQDLFETDLSPATVVTLYLLPEVNLLLRPKLLQELRPGTRIVSHSHDMGDWRPEQTLKIESSEGTIHSIHLWTVPDEAAPTPAP
jgi:trans-aconitate methyltransferase